MQCTNFRHTCALNIGYVYAITANTLYIESFHNYSFKNYAYLQRLVPMGVVYNTETPDDELIGTPRSGHCNFSPSMGFGFSPL